MKRFWLIIMASMALALHLGTGTAQSSEQVLRIEPRLQDGALYVDADVDLSVEGDLRNVAERGVPLYFTADLEIRKDRWWWFDKDVVDEQLTWRIVYNALTQQWRVGTGELSLPAASLDEALDFIRNIRGWKVADLAELEKDEFYEGRLRIRLDTSLLARPFQVHAINSSAWSLATPWKNFSFSISADAHQR